MFHNIAGSKSCIRDYCNIHSSLNNPNGSSGTNADADANELQIDFSFGDGRCEFIVVEEHMLIWPLSSLLVLLTGSLCHNNLRDIFVFCNLITDRPGRY